VQEAEADLGRRSAQLSKELAEVQREERRLGRRLETLDREAARRKARVETVAANVERTAGSRSFRLGHGFMSWVSRWLLWRPARRSALDVAGELLEETGRDLSRLEQLGGRPSSRKPSAETGQCTGG
jgi:hypothetical protein